MARTLIKGTRVWTGQVPLTLPREQLCLALTGPLLAMSAVIFPDSAAIQIFCCQIILIFYICVQVGLRFATLFLPAARL